MARLYLAASSAGGLFAGMFAAAFTAHRKLLHTAVLAVLLTAFWSIGMVSAVVILASTVLGGLISHGADRRIHRRPRDSWSYTLRDGSQRRVLAPFRSRSIARVWFALAAVLFGVCWVPFLWVANDADWDRAGVAAEGSLTVGYLGFACLVLGRKRGAISAQEAMARDTRPPVVFLRSFTDDATQQEGQGWWYEFRHSLQALIGRTREQRLAKAMKELGPFVAIGRPNEPLPELGAARMYVGDDDWQAVVLDLLTRARAIVLQAGESAGLRWEYGAVVRNVDLETVLLFVPFRTGILQRRERRYGHFRVWADEFLPPLPEQIGKTFFCYFVRDGDDWEARQLVPRAPAPKTHPLSPALRRLATDRVFHPRLFGRFTAAATLIVLPLLVAAFVSFALIGLAHDMTGTLRAGLLAVSLPAGFVVGGVVLVGVMRAISPRRKPYQPSFYWDPATTPGGEPGNE